MRTHYKKSGTMRRTLILCGSLVLLAGCSSENRDWDTARKKDTAASYQSFLQKHPSGNHAHAAKAGLEALVWESAKKANTMRSFEAYLKDYPQGKFAAEARSRIREFKYPFAKQGYENLRAADKPAFYGCGKGRVQVPASNAFVAEEETHISIDDLRRLFHWNGVERLFRVSNDENMAGIRIDDQGRSVLFGNNCLGNLQIGGSVVISNGLILKRNARLIYP